MQNNSKLNYIKFIIKIYINYTFICIFIFKKTLKTTNLKGRSEFSKSSNAPPRPLLIG